MEKKRTKLGLQADARFKAMGSGERTSKKVATIRKADGTSFKRKNANQFGAAEGDNDYTEKRSNRADKFVKGGGVGKKPKMVRTIFEDEEYEYGNGGKASGFTYSIGGL
jgi:hypothetical protein